MSQLSLFISCVSNEFGHYRDALRRDLSRSNLTTKIQEDFVAYGSATLQKLDEYIQQCDAVIHICGDMTGSIANAVSLEYINRTYPDFGQRFLELKPVLEGHAQMSYTQWEAWLAVYHNKYLFIATPTAAVVRNTTCALVPDQQLHQKHHLNRLRSQGRYSEITFNTEEGLALQLYRGKLNDLIAKLYPNKIFSLPYHTIGSLFKGRDEDLTKLHQCLKTNVSRPAAIIGNTIHGLGGIGKTRLAVEYAWSYRNEYTALLLVNADSPENLFTNLASLAAPTLLNLPEYNVKEEEVRNAAVVNWLNQHPGWLLVLDNADTLEAAVAVEKLFARLSGGYVLITSRQREWSKQVSQLPLDVLPQEAAITFLLERTEGRRRNTAKDEQLAAQICEELGWLVLALEQAGAYISTKRLTLAQYQQAWHQNHDTVLEWYNERLMQYPKSVAITWQTSFDQLSEPAKIILNRLAWLAPDPIPETLFNTKAAETDDFDYWKALVELDNYSLVNRSIERPELTVHRLVQDVTRRKQEKGLIGHYLEESLNWIDNSFIGDPYDVRDWPILESLLPHALVIINETDEKRVVAVALCRLMNEVSGLYITKAQYLQAELLLRKALKISEVCVGEIHPEVAVWLNNLAALLKDTNRLIEAETLMRRSLKVDEACLSENHPNVAIHLNNLAQLLKETNRLPEAYLLMQRALEIDKLNFGEEHPSVARDLHNIAGILKDTNHLKEAEILIRKALKINEISFGENHPNVAIHLNSLAQLLKDTSRLAEAEPLVRRAIEIDEMSFGKHHPNVARGLNNLANLLQTTNCILEAEPLLRRAIQIDEVNFGKDHPNVAMHLNSLAQLLQETDRMSEAELLMRRVLIIDEMSFGENHPNFATSSNNLAVLLLITSRLEEAKLLMQRAFIIFLISLGYNHPKTRNAGNNLIALLQEMGKTKEEIQIILFSLLS